MSARPSLEQDFPSSQPPTEPPTPRVVTRQHSRRAGPTRSKSRKRETRKTAKSIPRTVSGASWISEASASDWTDLRAPPPSLIPSDSSRIKATSSTGTSSAQGSADVYLDIDSSTVTGHSSRTRALPQGLQRSTSRATSRSGSEASSWFTPDLQSMRLADASVWQLDGTEPPLPVTPLTPYTLARAQPIFLKQAVPVSMPTSLRQKVTKAANPRCSNFTEVAARPALRASGAFSSHSMVDPELYRQGYRSHDLPYDLHTISSSGDKELKSKRLAAWDAAYDRLHGPGTKVTRTRCCNQLYSHRGSTKWLVIDALVILIILGLIATAVVLAQAA